MIGVNTMVLRSSVNLIKWIKKFTLFFVIFFIYGCTEEPISDEDTTKSKTVLVYMIAEDSNLYRYSLPNISSMSSCMSRYYSKNNNLIVYLDQKDQDPALLRIHDYAVDTIMKFKECNSTSSAILSQVIELTLNRYPADSYGLVMWSHGSGWLNQAIHRYVAPGFLAVPNRDSNPNSGFSYNSSDLPYYNTKAFGYEPNYSSWMEISDMATVIPDSVFDYILFDACFMGSVEVAYSLRKKADYIISSPYEIVSSGFPYSYITPDLFTNNYKDICNDFYSYYNNMSSWEKTGGVSLIQTSELDSLASCFAKIIEGKKEKIASFNIDDLDHIQLFDRFKNHVIFDFLDFVECISEDSDDLNEFKEQFQKCVPIALSTTSILDEIDIRAFGGVSVYIPVHRYDALVNLYYQQTEWSINTGYGQ